MKKLRVIRISENNRTIDLKLTGDEMMKAYYAVQKSYWKEDAKNAFYDYISELKEEFSCLLKMPFMDKEREIPKKKIRKTAINEMADSFTNDASISQNDEWYGLARDITAKTLMPHVLSYLWNTIEEKEMAGFKRFLKQKIQRHEIKSVFFGNKEYEVPPSFKRKNFAEEFRMNKRDFSVLTEENWKPENEAQVLLLALKHTLIANADTEFWHVLKFCEELEMSEEEKE